MPTRAVGGPDKSGVDHVMWGGVDIRDEGWDKKDQKEREVSQCTSSEEGIRSQSQSLVAFAWTLLGRMKRTFSDGQASKCFFLALPIIHQGLLVDGAMIVEEPVGFVACCGAEIVGKESSDINLKLRST